jgi:hypothetical protein
MRRLGRCRSRSRCSACLDASELADEVISRLNRNEPDNRLAVAVRDYAASP